MQLSGDYIVWIAWGSAVIIPTKLWFLIPLCTPKNGRR